MSELHGTGSFAVSVSRPGSPMQLQPNAEGLETDDSVTCQWEDCGKVFTHLPTLIDHIHNGECSRFVFRTRREMALSERNGAESISAFILETGPG